MSLPVVVEPLSVLDESFLRSRQVARAMINLGVIVLDGRQLRLADGTPDVAAVRRALAARTDGHPRFRQVLRAAPLGLRGPVWVPADHDLEHHVRLVPGVVSGAAGLDAAVSRSYAEPLDLSRPAWDLQLLDLDDGRVAALARVHHVTSDGLAGLAMLSTVFTAGPLPADAPPGAPLRARPPRSGLGLLVASTRQFCREHRGARAVWDEWSRKQLRGRLRRVVGRNIRGPRDAWVERRRPETRRPPDRHVALAALPLEALRAQARLAGGGLNDLLVAAVAQAVGGVGPVIVSVPISGRSSAQARGGNEVWTSQVSVPQGALASVVPQVREQVRSARRAGPGGAVTSGRSAVVVSMIPGPRDRLHLGERPIEQLVFVPALDPRDRLSVFGITYADRLGLVVSSARSGEEAGDLRDRLRDLLGAGCTA